MTQTISSSLFSLGVVEGALSTTVTFRNKVVGGDFGINPWNRGTTFSGITTSTVGVADAWQFRPASQSNGVFTVSKDTDVPTFAQASRNILASLSVTATTAETYAGGTGAIESFVHAVPGPTLSSLGFGLAGTRYATISFWVKATVTGIYTLSLRNNDFSRSYCVEYTINSSNTWEKKTVTFQVDTTGTWLTTPYVAALNIAFTIASGTAGQTSTKGSWQAGNYLASNNQVNGLGTIGNVFKLALVQLEAGQLATPFEDRPYEIERVLCGVPTENQGLTGNTPVSFGSNTFLQSDGSFGFRNCVIGGNFTTNPWQRGTTFTSTTAVLSADKFQTAVAGGINYTLSKVTDAPTMAQCGVGTYHSLQVSINSAVASPATGDYLRLLHRFEGLVVSSLGFGQSGPPKWITLSFWVKSNLTGTYSVNFRSAGGGNRTFVTSYTINSASTWEQKIITIPVDANGGGSAVWPIDNGLGLVLDWELVAGTNVQTSTVNTWQAGSYSSVTSQANLASSTSNTWQIALIQLEAGMVATPFEVRAPQTELVLCQRYYEKSYSPSVAVPTNASQPGLLFAPATAAVPTSSYYGSVKYSVQKRTTPSVVIYGYTSSTASAVTPAGGGADLAANSGVAAFSNENGFTLVNNSGGSITPTSGGFICHWIASADI